MRKTKILTAAVAALLACSPAYAAPALNYNRVITKSQRLFKKSGYKVVAKTGTITKNLSSGKSFSVTKSSSKKYKKYKKEWRVAKTKTLRKNGTEVFLRQNSNGAGIATKYYIVDASYTKDKKDVMKYLNMASRNTPYEKIANAVCNGLPDTEDVVVTVQKGKTEAEITYRHSHYDDTMDAEEEKEEFQQSNGGDGYVKQNGRDVTEVWTSSISTNDKNGGKKIKKIIRNLL